MVDYMLSEILKNIINKRKTVLSAEDKEFIQRNHSFWSSFPAKKNGHKILIEKPSRQNITHVNAVFTVILNQAKSFTPVWHIDGEYIEMFKSYVPTAEYIKYPHIFFDIFRIIAISIWKFLVMLKTDILAFSYDGVKYGDIIYDTYLEHEKVATIKKVDIKMLYIIYTCIKRHEYFKNMLENDAFDAVLVSHQVNIYSGVILRTALRYGYKGYLLTGVQNSTLHCFEKLDEIYDYPNKPLPEDVDTIIQKLGPKFDFVYESVVNEHVSGKVTKDALNAFSKDNVYYKDRNSFNRDYGLDPNKKNVFIMLHAFTDHPHSHFKWMLFKDYYDWFINTLDFANQNKQVNWIFKQHPSIKNYPTKDVSFDLLFSDVSKNIVYISEKKQIDTRSLNYCADLVVTCIGSAGFELPAIAGIPSVTAGDNFYTDLGFAIEPKTKNEYFSILSNAHNIERLTPEQQKRAQAAYIHIYNLSYVKTSACPIFSSGGKNDGNPYIQNYEQIYETYQLNNKTIKKELNNYIAEVAKPDFKRLNSMEDYFKSI